VGTSVDEIALLASGEVLVEDENNIDEIKWFGNNCDIIAIHNSFGGDALKFTHIIMRTPFEDWNLLKTSLSFLNKENDLNELYEGATQKFEQQFYEFNRGAALAIVLWTTNILYRKLNEDLGKSDYLKWQIYLKYLIIGLKDMNFYRGKVYRGFKNYRDTTLYKKGEYVYWPRLSSLSKSKEVATNFSNSNGSLFEVQVLSAKDISNMSIFPNESEVLLLPHCGFLVEDVVEESGNPLFVQLKEIPVPRGPKVVYWVDDNPQSNYRIVKHYEKKGISFVLCTSAKEALEIISNYRWFLYLDDSDFKIITDMVRFEEGKWNYEAGIVLVRELYKNYGYKFKTLVYCQDVEKASKMCENANINGPYQICNKENDLHSFLLALTKSEKEKKNYP
jgi:hypothetical protein